MPTQRKWKTLTCYQKGRILNVQFDTGNRLNTCNFTLMEELIELAQALHDDSELSAIILHGQEQVFCGGMDLMAITPERAQTSALGVWRKKMQLGPRMCELWERLEPITIAAIEGWCIGAGVALSAACDLRVLGRNSTLYVPEIERGMSMSWGSIPRMVSLIGPAKTKRFFALAEKVDAELALDWGIADEVVPDGQALLKALELAERAAAMPPVPLRMCKQGINAAAQALSHSVSYMDTDQLILTQRSEDFEEGVDSFLEKRSPSYEGR
ncbi:MULTISPECIES: enoyl-CoA hydratase/isomerase family protein [Marinobacter]|uniref:enoyl-CoA hydratase/isomerase family protein n=1 Tax=Marinobacter TaxID=2742 RepID=UPI001908FC63|nr:MULTISPECIES: enoyl-CoA hydratase/isomerase family protein [unclassified Marinobacter]MBK1887894.1 enoyl-CoA hydratase/isomerase family protein [Marinobacter sp. DY40_1A1]